MQNEIKQWIWESRKFVDPIKIQRKNGDVDKNVSV